MDQVLKLVRISDIAKQTTLSKSTLWGKISKGEFLAPTKIGGIDFWKQSDVNEWIERHFTKPEEKELLCGQNLNTPK